MIHVGRCRCAACSVVNPSQAEDFVVTERVLVEAPLAPWFLVLLLPLPLPLPGLDQPRALVNSRRRWLVTLSTLLRSCRSMSSGMMARHL